MKPRIRRQDGLWMVTETYPDGEVYTFASTRMEDAWSWAVMSVAGLWSLLPFDGAVAVAIHLHPATDSVH